MELNPNYVLMGVFLLHLLCVTWAGQSEVLMPRAFSLVHGLALLSGLVGICKPSSHESVLMFFLVMLLSMPIDIILLAIYKTRALDGVWNDDMVKEAKFSLAFSIIMMLTEPLLLFILYRLWRFRVGEPFILGAGQFGLKLAEAGAYGATGAEAQQGTANPFGPGYQQYAVGASAANVNQNQGPSGPSKGQEAGGDISYPGAGYQQQQMGPGAPVVMEGTYSTMVPRN